MDESQRPLPAELIDQSSHSETRSEPLRPEIVDGHTTQHGQQTFGQVTSVESSALVALSLAIASWFIIPIIGAIAALVVASSAKRRIRHAEAGSLAGSSMATAAQVIAWANLLLGVFIAWLIIVIIKAIF